VRHPPSPVSIPVLGALALVAGCFGGTETKTEGFLCRDHVECGEGLVCEYGHCRRLCARDEDCLRGGACIAALYPDEHQACVLEDPQPCASTPCPHGQVCSSWYHDGAEDRLCAFTSEMPCSDTTKCADGADCQGFRHRRDVRVCTLPADRTCELDAGADADRDADGNADSDVGCPRSVSLFCGSGGVCREACDLQRPCGDGYECVAGVCEERR
jgi:hypothetical protein